MSVLAKVFFVVAFWLGVIFQILLAQAPVYQFNHLGTEEGLSSAQQNNYVFNDGYSVWISSLTGLNRFDGKAVKVYQPIVGDSTSLFSTFASTGRMQLLNDGTMIFPNETGLIAYQRENDFFRRHYLTSPAGDTLPPYFQWGYLDQQNEEYWMANDSSVYVTSAESPGVSRELLNRRANLNAKVFHLADGTRQYLRLYPASPYFELYAFSGDSLIATDSIYSPDSAKVATIYELAERRWLVGTDQGLRTYDLTHQEWSPVIDTKANVTEIAQIVELDEETLLVGTKNTGLFYFDKLTQRFRGPIRQFLHDSIQPFLPTLLSLYVDDDRNLWVSTQRDGIYYTNLDKPKFNQLFINDPANYGTFTNFCTSNEQGGMWTLTLKGALFMSSAYDTTYYPLPISGTRTERGTFIFEDSKQRVWAGTLKWLFVKEKGEGNFKVANILPSSREKPPGYLGMLELPNGDLIVSTSADAKFRMDTNLENRHWIDPDEKRAFLMHYHHPYLFSAAVNNRLVIYHESDSGAFLRDTTFKLQQVATSIRYDKARKSFWISTFQGLYQLTANETGQFIISYDDRPMTTSLMSMEVGQDDALWFGTTQGLLRFDPDLGTNQLFHKADGLQDLESIYLSSLAKADGTLYFGGGNGINYFKPYEAISRIPPARPSIVEITINGEKNVLDQHTADGSGNPALLSAISLPFKKNSLGLRLSSREYSDPEKCLFSYRLLNSPNEQFSAPTTNENLSLGPLAYGAYVLEVKATNSDGIWSEEAIQLPITIRRPWYLTIWAFLITLALLALFGAWRLRKIQMVAELKTTAAENAQLAAETETAVLRLQMNPHFIFNSLNSIKAHILRNRTQEAGSYLTRFAKLMRMILNRSEQKLTSLEEELEFFEEYLMLEKQRMGKKLSWEFILEDDIDPYDTLVPTMVLQPFVENAIWHGIAPLESGGLITLHFRMGDVPNRINCLVTDNGVGRNFEQGSQKGHESKALSIIQRHLNLLGRDHEAGYRIKDLFHADGRPAGTQVMVWFPHDLE